MRRLVRNVAQSKRILKDLGLPNKQIPNVIRSYEHDLIAKAFDLIWLLKAKGFNHDSITLLFIGSVSAKKEEGFDERQLKEALKTLISYSYVYKDPNNPKKYYVNSNLLNILRMGLLKGIVSLKFSKTQIISGLKDIGLFPIPFMKLDDDFDIAIFHDVAELAYSLHTNRNN